MFAYPPEFLESLAGFGLAPSVRTPPALVRAAVNDLYRYELRALRRRLIAGEFERSSYLDRVIALRRKYWLLTLQLPAWDAIVVSRGAPDPTAGLSSGSSE